MFNKKKVNYIQVLKDSYLIKVKKSSLYHVIRERLKIRKDTRLLILFLRIECRFSLRHDKIRNNDCIARIAIRWH